MMQPARDGKALDRIIQKAVVLRHAKQREDQRAQRIHRGVTGIDARQVDYLLLAPLFLANSSNFLFLALDGVTGISSSDCSGVTSTACMLS